jgi:hypothetical protein
MSEVISVTVVATLIVGVVIGYSPWLAIRLVRWAARHMYAGNAHRAAQRREEWEALIEGEIPEPLTKLCFGLGFACAALYCIVLRRVPAGLAAVGRKVRRAFDLELIAAYLAMMAGLAIAPSLRGLTQAGIFFGLAICVLGLEWIIEQAKRAAERRRLSGTAP